MCANQRNLSPRMGGCHGLERDGYQLVGNGGRPRPVHAWHAAAPDPAPYVERVSRGGQMPISPPICEAAKAGLAKAKKDTARTLKELHDAERKLHELEAAQPPDEAAIEAQKAKVEQARAIWLEAKKKQKEWQESVDEVCNP
ncbi:hypothetical protein [Streptomyces sp. NPDC056431]|uniref:hypothetical protein n=1 Tax=Streptomyces sp. NPDC056431 TaxID=3345814 RepID=UPI00368B943E